MTIGEVQNVAKRERLMRRLTFREQTLEKLYTAYESLISGGVKSYTIDDRQLTRLDLPSLAEEIRELEKEIDELESQIANAGSARKAVGVIPRDW